MALVAWALSGTAWICLGGTIWAMVVVSRTSPRVVTTVVAMVELCGGGAAPPRITLKSCGSPWSHFLNI